MTEPRSTTSTGPAGGSDGAETRRIGPERRDSEVRQGVRRRLARIEGQIRGIHRMVDDGRYCVDILTQLAAVQQGLRQVSRELLRDHMGHCVQEAFESGDPDEKHRVSEEIAELMFKYSR
jgi:DNA-binding FrmR family transcriptional regulator